jgi:hypothetical protein
MIGPISHPTTGLHGAHVFLGSPSFRLILMLMVFIGLSYSSTTARTICSATLLATPFSQYASPYFIEFNVSMFFASYHRHSVDVIWFFVSSIYFVAILFLVLATITLTFSRITWFNIFVSFLSAES